MEGLGLCTVWFFFFFLASHLLDLDQCRELLTFWSLIQYVYSQNTVNYVCEWRKFVDSANPTHKDDVTAMSYSMARVKLDMFGLVTA
jgi:hypothetical protein